MVKSENNLIKSNGLYKDQFRNAKRMTKKYWKKAPTTEKPYMRIRSAIQILPWNNLVLSFSNCSDSFVLRSELAIGKLHFSRRRAQSLWMSFCMCMQCEQYSTHCWLWGLACTTYINVPSQFPTMQADFAFYNIERPRVVSVGVEPRA